MADRTNVRGDCLHNPFHLHRTRVVSTPPGPPFCFTVMAVSVQSEPPRIAANPVTPRVLLLSPRREDYLADGIFHGLPLLLGDRAVDYRKHEMMYASAANQALPRIRATEYYERMRQGALRALDNSTVQRGRESLGSVGWHVDIPR